MFLPAMYDNPCEVLSTREAHPSSEFLFGAVIPKQLSITAVLTSLAL